MKKMNIKHILMAAVLLPVVSSLTGCIEEETPKDVVTSEQVAKMTAAQKSLLYGIAAYMVKTNSFGSSTYYYNDWGYPCEMYFREICGEDFPIYKDNSYSCWIYKENASSSGYEVYTWNYYYRLIKNCNGLINTIDENTAGADSRRYLGQALLFRAMAYLDLARMFEFKPTGFDALDQAATSYKVWGLTVPIVTEDMEVADIQKNPRAPFFTMYRFIMTDLNRAVRLLDGYETDDKSLPGTTVAYGLMSRAWMEIGSRLDETSHSNSDILAGYADSLAVYNTLANGYDTLDVASAKDCYQKAISCADLAIAGDYTPMDSATWHSKTEGFNTANDSWMWRCRVGDKEQEPAYYFSFQGTVCSEPLDGLPYAYNSYRCISDKLYRLIGDTDWRKTSWISPADAGNKDKATLEKYQTLLADSQFVNLPAYANLKFRPGGGDINTATKWLIADLPLMRVEEMYFIKAEATARVKGILGGLTVLKSFIRKNRNASYNIMPANFTDLNAFIDEVMLQKRIEFWGEGITYFDYKRLNLQVDRRSIDNVMDQFKIAGRQGYCTPWMNFFIYTYETDRNQRCQRNPDPSLYYDE